LSNSAHAQALDKFGASTLSKSKPKSVRRCENGGAKKTAVIFASLNLAKLSDFQVDLAYERYLRHLDMLNNIKVRLRQAHTKMTDEKVLVLGNLILRIEKNLRERERKFAAN